MLASSYLNILSSYYKKENLEEEYNKDPKRLTTDNVNAIISGIYQLNNYDDFLSSSFDSKIQYLEYQDKLINDQLSLTASILSNKDEQLNRKLKESSLSTIYAQTSDLAEQAISAAMADNATSASIANLAELAKIVEKKLKIKTNNQNIYEYNGSTEYLIQQILSSVESQHALAADNANNSLEANHALLAEQALSSTEALYTSYSIAIIDMDSTPNIFNGSQEILISSVYSANSALYSLQTDYALSAESDIDGFDLNTLVKYTTSNDNLDFPILFSHDDLENVNSEEKNYVTYNEQVLINPYIGAIKANYFIGTAMSATYAACDMFKIPVNTRVTQVETSNNYNYPLLLAFIGSDLMPQDSKNNETLYSESIRLNPYNNVIYATTMSDDGYNGYIDYLLVTDTRNASEALEIPQSAIIQYKAIGANFVGLTTRAYGDYYGYKNNTRVQQFKSRSEYGTINLLAQGWETTSLENSSNDYVGNTTYINNLKYDCKQNHLHLQQTSAYIGGDLRVYKNTCLDKNVQITGKLNVAGATTLSNTLNVTGETTLSNTLNVTGATTLSNTLNVTGNGYFAGNTIKLESNKITCNYLVGTAQKAQWADIAEIYQTDRDYPIGTLIQFGGEKEITIATTEVNAVISENPAVLMNSKGLGQPIALLGKVKVLIKGPIHKFDYIKLSNQAGIGEKSEDKINCIGRALETNYRTETKLVMCSVKLEL